MKTAIVGSVLAAMLTAWGCSDSTVPPAPTPGWARTLGEAGSLNRGHALLPVDTGYLIAGSTTDPGLFRPFYGALLTADEAGGETNQLRYSDTAITSFFGIAPRAGGFLLAGRRPEGIVLLTLDEALGEMSQTLIPSPDGGNRLKPAGDGGYWMVGHQVVPSPLNAFGRLDLQVFKLDASGEVVWSRLLGADDTETGLDVSETPDGGCVVLGRTDSFSPEPDIFAARLSSAGDTLWTRVIQDSLTLAPQSILAAADGTIYLTADAAISSLDWLLLRLDGDGEELFRKRYGDNGGPENESGAVVVAGLGGNFILAGAVDNTDLWILEIDGDGNELRSRRASVGFGYFVSEVFAESADQLVVLGSLLNSGLVSLIRTDPDLEIPAGS